ncbi:MAG: hypothetical protein ACMXX6_01430 [Candidatus Woesearchaeota archaeon]
MYDEPVLLTGINANQALGPLNLSATAWNSRDKDLKTLVEYFGDLNASVNVSDNLRVMAGYAALKHKTPNGNVPRSMVYGGINANLSNGLSADISVRKGVKNFGDGYATTLGFNYKNPTLIPGVNTSFRAFGTNFNDFGGRKTTKLGTNITLDKQLTDKLNVFTQGEYVRNMRINESNFNARVGLRYNIK